MKKYRFSNVAGRVAIASACLFGSCVAHAQTSPQVAEPQEANGVGDIIVTAQKRSERLRDVPLSITAASQDYLKQVNVTDAAGLEKITTGFTYLQSAYGTPVFTIRGIGFIDVSVAGSPTVSVYVDQVPLPFALESAGAALDLERVEVLKGPQGTLFGQNSTGGAINYIAAKPTKTLQAGADVTYGRFNQINLNGFVSGPLSDTLRVRLAVRDENRGGWQKSYTRNDSIGKRDFLEGRVLLNWTPTERLSVDVNLTGWRDKSDTQQNQFVAYVPTNPNGYPDARAVLGTFPPAAHNPRAADWDAGANFARNDKFYQASLHADWQLNDDVTLTSITSVLRYDPFIPTDADGTPYTNLRILVDGSAKTFTQEARLAGDSGRLKWMVGGNYEHDRSRERDFLELPVASNSGVGPFRYTQIFIDNNQKIRTIAAFGSAEFAITDQLTAQASARYTDQNRAFDGCLRDTGDGLLARAFGFLSTQLSGSPTVIPAGACVTFNAASKPVTTVMNNLNQSNFSYRAGLNWKPHKDTLIYANIAQGYKAGGYSTIPGVRAAQFAPAVQEKLNSYEAGVKTTFFDRRVEFDGAIFYYSYKNKQILGFVDTGPPFGNLPRLVNVPKSDVIGGEVSLVLRPTSNLTVISGASYVDSRIKGSYFANDQTGAVVNVGGKAFPSAPKWQLNGDAQYSIPLSTHLKAFAGAHATYRSATSSFLGGNPYFDIPGYTLIDLRAGIESADGAWRAQLFGSNITNKYYVVSSARRIDAVARLVGMPATYGVTLSYRFK